MQSKKYTFVTFLALAACDPAALQAGGGQATTADGIPIVVKNDQQTYCVRSAQLVCSEFRRNSEGHLNMHCEGKTPDVDIVAAWGPLYDSVRKDVGYWNPPGAGEPHQRVFVQLATENSAFSGFPEMTDWQTQRIWVSVWDEQLITPLDGTCEDHGL